VKRSLILCAVIIIATALLGWREKQQISSAKETNASLVKEAAEIPGNDARSPEVAEQRKEYFAMKEKVKTLGRDFFALYREAPENPGAAFSEERLKTEAELKSRLGELDPAGIRLFMEDCNNNPGLNAQIRQSLNVYVQKVFIWKYPIEMARMMSQSPEKFGIGDARIYDPFAYLVYYYSGENPDLPTVFRCLSEAPPEFQSKYIGQATKYATDSPSRRAELLEEMRSFATTPEQKELVNGQLSELAFGRPDVKGSFIELTDWIGSAKLSSDELVAATKGMQDKVRVGETGQWLDWLAKSDVPEKVSKERAFELAARWTEKDYLAAGQWLNNAPDSPEKTAAVSAYAAKAYPYDPEGAMQWIQTLPQGPDRSKALETIYQDMPKDSDAAKAFASEFGFRK
jgi:hypothetical protein